MRRFLGQLVMSTFLRRLVMSRFLRRLVMSRFFRWLVLSRFFRRLVMSRFCWWLEHTRIFSGLDGWTQAYFFVTKRSLDRKQHVMHQALLTKFKFELKAKVKFHPLSSGLSYSTFDVRLISNILLNNHKLFYRVHSSLPAASVISRALTISVISRHGTCRHNKLCLNVKC